MMIVEPTYNSPTLNLKMITFLGENDNIIMISNIFHTFALLIFKWLEIDLLSSMSQLIKR